MSDSRPRSQNKLSAARAAIWRWLPHSLAVHLGLAVFVLILWNGHETRVAEKKEASKQEQSTQEAKQTAGQIRSQLEEMRQIHDKLEEVEKQRMQEYQDSLKDMAAEAVPKARELLEQAARAQDTARQNLDKSLASNEKTPEPSLTSPPPNDADREKLIAELDVQKKEALKADDELLAAQSQSRDLQNRALQSLSLAASNFDPAKETVRRAAEEQKAAEDAQKELRQTRSQLAAREAEALRLAVEAQRVRDAQAKLEASLRDATAMLAPAQQKAEQDLARANELKQQAETLKKTPKTPEITASLKQTSDQAREAAKASGLSNEELKKISREIELTQRRWDNQKTSQADRIQNALAASREKVTALREAKRNGQETVRQAQQKSQASLQQAMTQFQQAAAAPPQNVPPLPTETLPAMTSPPVDPGPEAGVTELYQSALEVDQSIAELNRRQRAAELAMIQRSSLKEAYESQDASNPARPSAGNGPLDPNHLKSDEEAARFQQISSGMQAMVGQARKLGAGNKGTSFYLDWVKKADQSDSRTAGLATSTANGQAVDLTQVMNGGIGEGLDTGAKQGTDYYRKAADGAATPPVITSNKVKTVPGRRIGSGGTGAEWMLVDSWYLIGPFSNPGRSNRTLRFPPEERVNLDAVYPGKNGQKIRWSFIQWTKPGFAPQPQIEYSVYYAYTELWFDEPQDLWIAMGCDDSAKIWIEDQLVYVSQDHLKPWSFAEALRRVHFKKGLNRILYRIENGPKAIAFSLAVYLRDKTPAPVAGP